MGPTRWVLCLAGLVACVSGGYRPGELLAEAPPSRAVTLGCLDVVMTSSSTLHDATSRRNVVLGFAFGNRCDYAVRVDFGALAVVGLYGDGRVPLFALDPRGEVHPAMLGGRGSGYETFEFEARDPRPAPPPSACVTLDGLTDAPREAEPVTRCFTFVDPTPAPFAGDIT